MKMPTSEEVYKFIGKAVEKGKLQAKVLAAKGARFVEPPSARKLRKLGSIEKESPSKKLKLQVDVNMWM